MPGSILGNSVVRVEDPDLLTGLGTFVDNLPIPGALHLAFVRSSAAHALIEAIDTDEARAMPGVVAVYTAADLGVPPQKAAMSLNDACLRPPLADTKVRFVGEPVAAVVADTRAAALDAAEMVVVSYEPLDAVTDAEAALAPGAPVQFDELGTNLVAGFRAPGATRWTGPTSSCGAASRTSGSPWSPWRATPSPWSPGRCGPRPDGLRVDPDAARVRACHPGGLRPRARSAPPGGPARGRGVRRQGRLCPSTSWPSRPPATSGAR